MSDHESTRGSTVLVFPAAAPPSLPGWLRLLDSALQQRSERLRTLATGDCPLNRAREELARLQEVLRSPALAEVLEGLEELQSVLEVQAVELRQLADEVDTKADEVEEDELAGEPGSPGVGRRPSEHPREEGQLPHEGSTR